jgi:hypothetical protein
MSWVEACREYAKKAGKYMIPKKGTAEYDEVRKLMGSPASSHKAEEKKSAPRKKVEMKDDEAPKPKRGRKAKEDAPAPATVKEAVAEMKEEKKKAVKPRASRKPKAPKTERVKHAEVYHREVEIKESNAVEAKPRVVRGAKAKAGSVESGIIPEGATKKAVMKSKNPSAVLESATNAHLPIVPEENMLRIKPVRAPRSATLVERPELPTLVDKERPVSMPAFSFQKLRDTLGA